jgi:hypothetical protein
MAKHKRSCEGQGIRGIPRLLQKEIWKHQLSFCVPVSKATFKDKYTEITEIVDAEMKKTHGIMCYQV